jgi:hypothetical protein
VGVPQPARRAAPGQVVSIRLERKPHHGLFRVILIAVAALTAIYLVLMGLARLGEPRFKKNAAHPPRERFEADALLP